MTDSMGLIVKNQFTLTPLVIDRFYVHKLALNALY